MFTMKVALGISVCLCLAVVLVNGDEDKTESDLRRTLFEHYDKLVRPVTSTSHTVQVTTTIYPLSIKDVNVEDRTVKLDTWFIAKWRDEFLHWDPTEYGGLTELRIPASEVWIPDLSIYHGTPDENIKPKVLTNVVIYSNGTVLWVPPFTIKARCPRTENQVTDETFQCTILLGSWTYDVTLVDIHEVEEVYLAEHNNCLGNNPKWALESITPHRDLKFFSCCVQGYPIMEFDMKFRKKHGEDHN